MRPEDLGIDPDNPNPDGSDYHLMNILEANPPPPVEPPFAIQAVSAIYFSLFAIVIAFVLIHVLDWAYHHMLP
jgi:hypothetical protein